MDWAQFRRDHWNKLDPVKREAAADFLRQKFTEEDHSELRQRITENPGGWIFGRKDINKPCSVCTDEGTWEHCILCGGTGIQKHEWGFHFTWGMAVRNLLRSGGFGEKELEVDNLDDYYVAIIEMAVMGSSWM